MYRPGPDPPQFRPVPAAPPPPSMMNMGQYVPHNPVPPSMPPLMPPAGPHSIPPSMPPPSMPSSMPPLGPPSIPAPPTISGRPYAMPQFSFPAPSVARPSAPTLPALGPPLPMMQPSPPVAVTHSPLSMASGHHHSLTGHRPPLFLPPLPPSPPSENPPPPPPSPPPPLPPPPPSEESTVVRLLPPQPLKPSDQEILKNIDVLVPYVVKNGPKFESFTRAKQAGDPKFSFLFEDNGSLEGVVAHEYYKWKKKCFELQLEAEDKASKHLDYGRALGRTQEADGMPRQVANEEDMIAPASPAMSDMDMEDDFAVSPPRRENVGQSGHVKTADFAVVPAKRENTEQSGHVHTSTSVEIDLSSEKCAIIPSDSSSAHLAGASKFGTISHKQDPLLVFGSAAKRPATGCTTEMDQSLSVGGKENANEQMSTIKAGTDYRDNTLNSGKQMYSTERPSYDFNTESFSASSGIPQVHDSVESIDKRSLLGAGINIIDQDAHVGTSSTLKIVNQSVDEFLPRTLDHSSRQMTRLPQEHRAARVSRWGTLPPSPTLQENQDDEKQYQAGSSQADSSGRREEGASPTRKSSCFEDVHDSPTKKSSSPKDIHVSLKGSNRKEEVEFVNDKPGADAGLQRHTDNMLVDEFGRIVREGMSESDSEERRRPRKHRRSRSRSRGRNGSRSRSRSGGRGRSRSMSRSISRSRSPEGSRWRRRSFSPSPHRRGRWSRSRSRSPPWRRSYSRTPPRDSRWGGPGRGSRDWRGDREFYGRGRRGGRGGGPNLCIHYARGRCARGTACRYLHADREFMPQERGPWMRDERLDPPNARDGENMAQDRGAQWARKQRHEFVNARDGEAMPRERGGWIREGGVQADRTELGNARDCEAMVQDRSSWPREEAHERFHARDVGTDQHAQFLERQGVEPVSKWGKIQANADDASAVGKSFDPKEAHMLVATDAEVEARKLDFGEKRESYQKFDLDGVVEKVDIRKVLEHSKVPEKGDGEVSIEVNMASDSPTGMDIVDVENGREGTKKAGESDATEDNHAVVRLKSGQETCVRIKTEDDGTTDVGDQPGIVNKTTLMTENDPVEKFSATDRAEIGEGGFSDEGDVGVGKKMDLLSTSLKLQGLDVRVPGNFGSNEDENQQVVEEENHSSKVHKVNESMEKPDQAVGGKEDSLEVQVEEKSRMIKDTVKQAEGPKRPEVKSNEEHSLPWESGPLVQSSQKTALMTPVSGVAAAHVLTAAAAAAPPPPSLSYSQANSMGPPLSTATSLAFGQPPTSIGRPYMPGYVQQQANAPAHTFPSGNMPPYSQQANSFALPVNNLQNATAGQTPSPGNFNVLQPPPFGHQPYGQQAGVVSGSVPRQSFPPGNAAQYRPNLFPGPPMHEGPYQQGLNFGGVFPPRPGISQSSIVPQQPVQQLQSGFPANQRLGFPSHVPPQGPPSMPYPVYPANLGVPPEQQPLPRPFTSDSSMQYLHPTSIDSGVQNAYGRSLTLPQSSMPWALPTSSEVSVMSQRTGQPSAYSYSLTTVPPLKVPGVIELKSPADQYDPLSDCLDPNPKSITPASNALSARLENVSPSPMEKTTHEVEAANVNEAGADVGVVENVSPPGNWSPEQPVDGAEGGQDQAQSKSKKNSRGLKLLRSAVAEHVKELLKPTWREGHLSKEAFKTIAKKAVDKVTGNLPNHHIPKSQEKVDHFMAVSRTKISKLVQGYVDKYLKL